MEELRNKLCERLKETDWWDKWRFFLYSSEFMKILETLQDSVREDEKRFVPPVNLWLRPFLETPLQETRVVFLVPAPHHFYGYADGLALSSIKKGVKFDLTLQHILNDISQRNPEYVQEPDLGRWAKQGVLLINAAWTTQMDRRDSHAALWNPATCFLIDILKGKDVVWVFWGSAWDRYQKMVKSDKKMRVDFSPETNQVWHSEGMFEKVNELIEGEKIVW